MKLLKQNVINKLAEKTGLRGLQSFQWFGASRCFYGADNGNLLISNGSERRQAVIMEDCA